MTTFTFVYTQTLNLSKLVARLISYSRQIPAKWHSNLSYLLSFLEPIWDRNALNSDSYQVIALILWEYHDWKWSWQSDHDWKWSRLH